MIWGLFACAPKVEKMISSPRKDRLRQLILLPLDIIAPQTYLYLRPFYASLILLDGTVFSIG
jgi:hypothetical protein